MKNQETKKRWLSGLLIGLVMLVGVGPAMAYTFVASFDCSGVSGDYSLGRGDRVYLGSDLISDWAKYAYEGVIQDDGYWDWTGDGSNFNVSTVDDNFGTSWTVTFAAGTDLPGYVLFKGGSGALNCDNSSGGYVYLFKLDGTEINTVADPFTMSWTYGSADPANFVLPSSPMLSHLTFYDRTSTTVPIPGAVWLLTSGFGALVLVRRRRKEV
ncbi:MAG: VPLPA-CTERM sorting domain-containing protein [Pseudomonadota bacterium]|nr:VPLPA-CTERM sorting domain-containing protein [Pseudomonadota bacterium]